ncbi:nucleolar pre-ribosomal-associated protein 1 [Desmophyllum pertusum]|uniref:Nucleolar pre-ribosomal-associated protein 1 n=1 Tax=Desmophyllum pertusum TaxID=174260 RepID=A0A9W9ZY73_9CNID|nr:nucleolar pre-ribosomal-associated protein 1 [Desmophyllum pertusum]
MVTQGPSAAREVQRSFDFTLKSLSSLPNKRDSKSAQDVRTCFIYFCLSFLMFGDLAVMKQILELKGFLQSVMKGLQFDTPDVVHAVLSTLQVRVAQNSGITKKSKVQFFNSYVLSQLANLYQYTKDAEEENNKSDQTVRRKVHDLLLKICGSFKLGICFSNTAGAFAMRSNNPVLLKFLQSLSSVMTDVLIQDLVITVLCCCQDVTKPFLSSLTVTYEPRLSMPWITNMNLLTKVRKY